ncbi:MAG: hypothetical protein CMD35_08310 [Flavobacteriales bacterium]|nr:hypothetical protein [Flavobacteriales bacterium]
MKKLIPYLTLITTLFTGTLGASNQFDEYEKVHIHQLKTKQPNTIKLKMNYAGTTFVSKSNMNALQNNEILQVDLVYTSFKRDANFDQLALNKKRITQLKKEHSIFSNKNIKWQFIEQEGATDFKEAKDYFHGFVVHFGKSLNYKTLSNSYSGIQKEFNAYPMNNSGGILHYNSGTKIKIQPNSVTYEDGTPVKGEFEIKYREFRNAAEIAFSGIPMTFNGQNFNSVGMYEIRGEQNGKTLKLTQPAVVNFQCTKGDAGVGFYHLDESSSKWEKVKQITKNKAENIEIKKEIQLDSPIGSYRIVGGTVKSDNGNYIPVPVNHNKTWISSEMLAEKKEKITFGDYSWGCYNKVLNQIGDSIKEIKRDEDKQEVVLSPKSIELINQRIRGNKIPRHFLRLVDSDGTLLADGADKGHTYPSLVKGLNSSSFGVYNCDQVYRIANRTTLLPKYVDENGNQIQNQHVLCVVDLKYNGSFSYNPNSITVDKKGKNVLLLFTEDKKLFVLSEEAYQKMNKDSAQPTIVMTDMTSELSSTKALKEYLNI